jgi:anaerobic selenocysteine-containing dehydrogenase
VWEENEWWIELSARMDPDGALGVRHWFESPYRAGEIITVEEYYRWIFENSVPGLPEAAAADGLTPLAYMRKYGAFEIVADNYRPFDNRVAPGDYTNVDQGGRVRRDGQVIGVMIDGEPRTGVPTPSRKLEFFSPTIHDWGWPEREYTIPWTLKSHVHPDNINRANGEMLLLPNFRLPTLIHTRSANAKWLYEISHKNPVWLHPSDAERLGVATGDLLRVETEIGYLVDRAWVTEAIMPGIIALSHHLGRWRLQDDAGLNPGMSSLADLTSTGSEFRLRLLGGAKPWESFDPDSSRVWWSDVGVHQNLTHAVHPDPLSGAHCWLQKAVNVRKAGPEDRHGDVFVDTEKSMQVYREWRSLARPAVEVSPDGTRRPLWLARPLKPTRAAYRLPDDGSV